ncbi:MAG TPA: hypothetical protein EYN91_12460 [Candidatus Melainabacteria bacterium]|nr:hypothetical protein [Candidatus Melainabacteria bacterium]
MTPTLIREIRLPWLDRSELPCLWTLTCFDGRRVTLELDFIVCVEVWIDFNEPLVQDFLFVMPPQFVQTKTPCLHPFYKVKVLASKEFFLDTYEFRKDTLGFLKLLLST